MAMARFDATSVTDSRTDSSRLFGKRLASLKVFPHSHNRAAHRKRRIPPNSCSRHPSQRQPIITDSQTRERICWNTIEMYLTAWFEMNIHRITNVEKLSQINVYRIKLNIEAEMRIHNQNLNQLKYDQSQIRGSFNWMEIWNWFLFFLCILIEPLDCGCVQIQFNRQIRMLYPNFSPRL